MKGQDKRDCKTKPTNLVLAPCSIVALSGYNSLVCRAETLHLLSPAANAFIEDGEPTWRYFHVRHAIYVKLSLRVKVR